MSQEPDDNPTAEVNFILNFEGFDDELYFSPKLLINFQENCYIHQIATTEDGDKFEDWETLEIPNYPE